MHRHKGFDNLSQTIFENHFTVDFDDNCDYELDTSNYSWTEDDFIVLNINIRGLYSKIGELNRLVELVEGSGSPPTVITISETWLNQHSPSFEIPGYRIFRTDRLHKKGGGVAVLVSNRLCSRKLTTIGTDPAIVESCIVEIKGNFKPIVVSSLYRPPNTNTKLFLDNYRNLITQLKKITPEIIISLDHNLDFLKSDYHGPTNDFVNLILDQQQLPTISRPTRIARQSATLIDNIIVNQSHCEKITSLILIDDTSDHLPCVTVLHDLVVNRNKKQKIKTRSFKNIYRVQEELSKADWTQLQIEADVDVQTDVLQSKLKTLLDAHCPEQEKEISYKNIWREPWMTTGLMSSVKCCKQLYKKSISRDKNNYNAIVRYRDYSRVLSRTKRSAKVKYYMDKCTEYRSNTKNLWKIINKIVGKTSNKCDIIDYIKVDNIKCYSSQLIANEFGRFFSNIGKNYAEKIPKPRFDTNHYLDKIESECRSIYLDPVTSIEIDRLIENLPNNTSSGV